jgi:hypothetical protein
MYNIFLTLHSLLRWVILILLVVNIIRHFSALSKPFTTMDKKLGLWLMICAHITLLIGLYQYFAGDFGFSILETNDFGKIMKNDAQRFWAIEHIFGMIVAIILITIGKGVARKNISDNAKHKRSAWFFLIAFLIIMATIPWPWRAGIGRPLIPGMH